jgi:5-methylcytosine-specific restriction endonuclease McrBC GTP-binding regulatory subunit McrB
VKRRYAELVSVRPDWTDNRGLLGFHNLITQTYQTTDFLRLLVQATLEPTVPHFVILDEMNLAKVEYYFADFLSVLESRYLDNGELKQAPLRLHDLPRCVLVQGQAPWGGDEDVSDAPITQCHVRCEGCPLRSGISEDEWSRGDSDYEEVVEAGFDPADYIPPRLIVPPNVYFSGTVNVDETTYMFSPKVLDRANTIEFNEVDLVGYFAARNDVVGVGPASDVVRDVFTFGGDFLRLPKEECLELRTDESLAPYRKALMALNGLLKPYNMHFGYRVVDEILLYLRNAHVLDDPGYDLDQAFDHQILQKILPKFHGSQAKLQEPLENLREFCSGGGEDGQYPYATRKILRMLDALEKEGFASFA